MTVYASHGCFESDSIDGKNVKTVHVKRVQDPCETCAEIHVNRAQRTCETCDACETCAFHVKHAQTFLILLKSTMLAN